MARTAKEAKDRNLIILSSAWVAINKMVYIDGAGGDMCVKTDPQIEFNNASVGDILNYYQDLVVASQWDIRYRGDIPVVTLGRDHMYLMTQSINKERIRRFVLERNENINNVLGTDIDTSTVTNETCKHVFDMLSISKKLQSLLTPDEVSNVDVGSEYDNSKDDIVKAVKQIDKDSFNEDYLFRNNYRKMSEEHFAISGYNLISHSIDINEEIPNVLTVSSTRDNKPFLFKFSLIQKELLQLTDDQKAEVKYFAKDVPLTEDVYYKTRLSDNEVFISEHLSAIMMQELSYSYQGKIFITFNSDIEIGDTIHLMDNTTQTFGTFTVDAFEHSFDERGLLTVLYVKAKVKMVDPYLEMYALKYGYEMAKNFNTAYISRGNLDVVSNVRLKNIFGYYLKHVIQSPKVMHAEFVEESGYDRDHIVIAKGPSYQGHQPFQAKASYSPYIPYTFYPLIKKGKMMFPKTLEYAFFGRESEIANSIFMMIIREIFQGIRHGFWGGVQWTKSVLVFAADFVLSTASMGITDLLKPHFFHLSQSEAFKTLISNIFENTDKTAKIVSKYSPYDGSYSLGDFDLTLCFFNVQGQTISNMFPKTIEQDKTDPDQDFVADGDENSGALGFITPTDEEVLERINYKVSTIHNIIKQACDVGMVVELYDTFKYKDLYDLEDLKSDIMGKSKSMVDYVIKANQLRNKVSTEHTMVLKDFYKIKNVGSDEEVDLVGDRKAIITKIDISDLQIDAIKTLHIVWVHNYYGEKNLVKENAYEERRQNVQIMMDSLASRIDNNNAVMVVGDFNLVIYNHGERPVLSGGAMLNAIMELDADCPYIAMNKKPTTLNMKGEPTGNPYDNVMVSKNFSKYVRAFPFVYPVKNAKDRRIVSDHLPLVIGIKK